MRLQHFVGFCGIPPRPQPPKALLEWLDDACLYRYLRARQGHVDKALAMLQNSVKWRQEFGVARLPTDHFSDVAVIGCVPRSPPGGRPGPRASARKQNQALQAPFELNLSAVELAPRRS